LIFLRVWEFLSKGISTTPQTYLNKQNPRRNLFTKQIDKNPISFANAELPFLYLFYRAFGFWAFLGKGSSKTPQTKSTQNI
jgi:hypothetical protein